MISGVQGSLWIFLWNFILMLHWWLIELTDIVRDKAREEGPDGIINPDPETVMSFPTLLEHLTAIMTNLERFGNLVIYLKGLPVSPEILRIFLYFSVFFPIGPIFLIIVSVFFIVFPFSPSYFPRLFRFSHAYVITYAPFYCAYQIMMSSLTYHFHTLHHLLCHPFWPLTYKPLVLERTP